MIEPGTTQRQDLSLLDQNAPQGQMQAMQMGPGSGGPPHGSEPSLREFISVLRRRKLIAIQTFVVVVAVGAVTTFMTKPQFRSTAKILVEGKASALAINNTSDSLSQLFLPSVGHDVATQVEVLRSPTLLQKVCKRVNAPASMIDLDVRQVGQTDVIQIDVTSAERELAKNFAAALPQQYLDNIKESGLHEVTGALQFAKRRLKERTSSLESAERQLQIFKSRSGVVDTLVEKPADISALATARASARDTATAAAGAHAALDALNAARHSLSRLVDTPVTNTNPELQTLQNQIDTLEGDRANLLFLYKPDHPKVRQIDAQIADAKARLKQAPATVTTHTSTVNPLSASYDQRVAEARATASSADASESAALARVANLEKGLQRYPLIERTQAQLQRDIEEGQAAVSLLATSVEQLGLRLKATEAKDPPITVTTAASRASQVAPNIVRNLILAVLVGLLMGCGAAMLQDSLDDHINDEDELRWLLDVPILGHLPLLPNGESRLVSLRQADAQLLERFRVIRSNVQFTLVNRASQILQVTSTIPAEGKSSTAANLAIAIALDARPVILVDADLHRPRIHGLFGTPQQPGLSNVLAGQAKLEDALFETDIPGLRVLPAGVLPPNPAELLNSDSMSQLLTLLRGREDVVIFDTPPCLATADAQVLSARVDGVIYIMELGKIRKSAVQRSFELLYQARAHVLGVVFNKISEVDRSHYYDYGYYGYGDGGNAEDALESAETGAEKSPQPLTLGHGDVNGSMQEKS